MNHNTIDTTMVLVVKTIHRGWKCCVATRALYRLERGRDVIKVFISEYHIPRCLRDGAILPRLHFRWIPGTLVCLSCRIPPDIGFGDRLKTWFFSEFVLSVCSFQVEGHVEPQRGVVSSGDE